MANFSYNTEKYLRTTGQIDYRSADVRVLLVGASSSIETEKAASFLADFTSLDELGGTGYDRKTLANKGVTQDNVNNRAEFLSDAVAYTAISAGVVKAMLFYLHVTNDTDSIPLFYIDTVASGTAFPVTTNGGDLTVTPNAEGWLQTA